MANPSFNGNKQENSDELSEMNRAQWICPITGLEMNGTFKFFALFNCGCVFSERAYKTIQSSTKLNCLKCEKPFTLNDMITLNPNEEELEQNKSKHEKRKELAAKAKAEKLQLKNGKDSDTVKTASGAVKDVEKEESGSKSSHKRSFDSISSTEKSKPTSSSASSSSLAHGSINGAAAASGSNVKKVKSVQDDPNASSVYKSLFTSSDKAKNQQKAHWVTFNPQYF